MKILLENWRGFLNEEIEEDDTLDAKIRQALIDEGGAAGMEALEKHTGKNAGNIRTKIEEMDDVGEHPNGDYILSGGEIVIKEEMLEEKSANCTGPTKKTSSTSKGKKWMKCVKSDSGGWKRIHWGQKGVRVTGKSGDTKRKKSFKARHGCSTAKSNTPKGQACKDWA